MKKVLVITGSARRNGNSDLLASQFAKGAKEAGCEVEVLHARNYKINYCLGCLACTKLENRCVQIDDMNDLLPKLLQADVICFATPVYYFDVTALMKLFLDRLTPLFEQHTLKNKDFYYLVACAEDNRQMMEHAFKTFENFAYCFEEINEKGRVLATKTFEKGSVKDNPAFKEAYLLGKSV